VGGVMIKSDTVTTTKHLYIDSVVLNLNSGIYFTNGDDAAQYKKMGSNELLLLNVLLENIGNIIEKERLLNAIWTNKVVTDSSLYLRQAI